MGFGFDLSAAEEPSGAELCSFAPVDESEDCALDDASWSAEAAPEEGAAELRSCAPPDVSAEPLEGSVACFAASGLTPDCVGSCPASDCPEGVDEDEDEDESAAMAGAKLNDNATALVISRRCMAFLLEVPQRTVRPSKKRAGGWTGSVVDAGCSNAAST